METGTSSTPASTGSTSSGRFNLAYLKTADGVFTISEVVCGLLCWSLIVSVPPVVLWPAYQFVLVISIVSWLISL